jgi:hypothetical protein
MAEEPDEIREQIDDTRERMTDTVEALAYKADVKSRAKDRLQGTGQRIAEVADQAVASVRGTASSAVASVGGGADRMSGMASNQKDTVKSGARRGATVAKENPLGLALGAAAAGFLIGVALPSTRIEDEKIGETADAVKQSASEMGHEVLERGKAVAQEATKAGVEAAKSTGQEQAQELTATVKDKAEELKPST